MRVDVYPEALCLGDYLAVKNDKPYEEVNGGWESPLCGVEMGPGAPGSTPASGLTTTDSVQGEPAAH